LLEQGTAALLEVAVVQVLRRGLERVEERARHRGEDRLPAQQAKQAVEQRVLHIVGLPALGGQVLAHGLFNA